MHSLAFTIIMAIVCSAEADITFKTTDYFVAYQVRLYPNNDGSMFIYSLANPVEIATANISNSALALSGYDFSPNGVLSFATQLSLNQEKQNTQILISTANGTKFYFLSFFLLTISKKGSVWMQVQSYCFNSSVAPFVPNLFRYTEQHFFQGPFNNDPSDGMVVIPYINSITTYVDNTGYYFNITQALSKNGSTEIYINLFRNYSYLISACVTLLVVKQNYLLTRSLTAFDYSGLLFLDSSRSDSTLEVLGNRNFGMEFAYGPKFQPKCVIGFQSFLIDHKQRSTLTFDISQMGVTRKSASSQYVIGLSFACFADIICPLPTDEYYPLIGDCEPLCKIANCLVCSSSTSCQQCNSTFFINSLQRCSSCMANCIECLDAISCRTCTVGYYYSVNVCQLCSLYCLNCSITQCYKCADGYTANGTKCVSCQVVMSHCLTCFSAAVCITCQTTYAYNSNTRSCQSCSSMMPNCQLCDIPNNCLVCKAGYYKYSFNLCKICSYDVEECCASYISHCSVCNSNSSCKACSSGFFLNQTTKNCSQCKVFGNQCLSCNSGGCLHCIDGLYMSNGSCVLCSQSIARCTLCSNSSTCLQCTSPYIFARGQCINCPIWPLNNLYFIDQNVACQLCSKLDSNCQTCTELGLCLSCNNLNYLLSGQCKSCSSAIAFCSACKQNSTCSICQNGYFVNLSNQSQCLSCSLQLSNCLACYMEIDILAGKPVYTCQKCMPEYFPRDRTCTICSEYILNCLTCINSVTCLECRVNYYLNSDSYCVSCDKILPGCKTCLSSTVCGQCGQGYLLQGSYCSECITLTPNCISCHQGQDIICDQCTKGYYLSPTNQCSRCNERDELCTACTYYLCTSCLSTYYVTPFGQCKKCYELIPNCKYCDSDLACQSCLPNYVFDPIEASCELCQYYVSGCSTCNSTVSNITNAPMVSCLTCQDHYLAVTKANFEVSCLLCSSVLLYCENCLTISACQKCESKAFLGSDGKCSLCQIYLTRCAQCSDWQSCLACKEGYALGADKKCVFCDLSLFGTWDNNLPLCASCDATGQSLQCSQCITGSYLNVTTGSCIFCRAVIVNCKNCIDSKICIQCLQGYYLSPDGQNCLSCPFQNCAFCTNTACTGCVSTSTMIDNKCVSCDTLIEGCSTCNSTVCFSCKDSYYFTGDRCLSCSSIESGCVLCSNQFNCLLKDPSFQIKNRNTVYLVIGVVCLGLFLVGLIVFVVWCCKNKAVKEVQAQENVETNRRLGEQAFENQIKVKDGKVCHYCTQAPPRFMKIQLLCQACAGRQGRGESHKIEKDLKKDWADRIKQDDISLKLDKKSIELSQEKVEQQHKKLIESSKKQQVGQLQIQSRVPAKFKQRVEKESNREVPSTKSTTSEKHRFIRDLF